MNLLTDEEMVKVMWNIAQLLTDDEVCKITQFDRFRAIAKAQTVKLIKWLDEPCTDKEHYLDFLDSINFSQETLRDYEAEYHSKPTLLRKDCPNCWNELKQEVGL